MIGASKDTKQQFAQRLRKYMSLTDTRAVDIAKQFDISQSTVSLWLSGRSIPSLDRIEMLAKILGCRVPDLTGKEEQEVLTVSNMSAEEYTILYNYRSADDVTKDAINRLLAYSNLMNKGGGHDQKP